MSTPIETVVHALRVTRDPGSSYRDGVARAVLASLAQHRDDIAEVLDTAMAEWNNDVDTLRDWDTYLADAVLAYLQGDS